MFLLDSCLKKDTFWIGDLPLCHALLMNVSCCPWVILVPRRENLREIHDLILEDQQLLMEEMIKVSKMITQQWMPDKINVGALGNIVPQLHLHIVGRFQKDPAWPGPIWGKEPLTAYSEMEREKTLSQMRQTLIPNKH